MATLNPPRTLIVQKFVESRAPELESLHGIVSARLGGDFRIRRSKRRRTTGFRGSKNKIRKRQKLGDGEERKEKGVDPIRIPRRIRRSKELRNDPESGFTVSGDGTKRLRTHLWHAKRFTMAKKWGFYLPLGLHGSGRGSRAVLKWLKYGAVVHDRSYCHAIQLEGPEDNISAILRMVLMPCSSHVSEEISLSVKYGACFKNSMLYHAGMRPLRFISPVMYMWRPILNEDKYISVEIDHVSNGCSTSRRRECGISSRQLWIWIHTAALEEGLSALRSACQKQMQETGVSVSCFSLKERIAKLEVMGSKAVQILQKILHPVSEACNSHLSSYMIMDPNSQLHKPLVLEHAEHLPSHAILSLTVSDPRDMTAKETKTSPEGTGRSEFLSQADDSQNSNALIAGASTKVQDKILMLWSKPGLNGTFLADNRYLWDSTEKLNPPIPENILCSDRHHRRRKFLYLDSSNHDEQASGIADGDQSCPILLLKHANQGNLNSRWSIILPLNWVKAFWIPLVSQGAHVIGLRERRWIASDSKIPSFPFDFPDCQTYSVCMAAEATASENSAELRPLAVRPSRVPIPPPWNCLVSTLKKELIGNVQTSDVQSCGEVASEGPPLLFLEEQNSDSLISEQDGALFGGFVPRTTSALSEYLGKFLHGNVNLRPDERRLCLERVLLHAYKEGVFEEGAIVCAPIPTDLLHWESRSEEHEKLEMPQSLVKTYFTQQDSGKWELQKKPDKCSSPESYRWPIGFVTSGFVRGSKKPVAVAFCEAKLLDQLREQQARQMAEDKEGRLEIFVLVRNVRSTAYRRALATILLEQEKEDVEFM